MIARARSRSVLDSLGWVSGVCCIAHREEIGNGTAQYLEYPLEHFLLRSRRVHGRDRPALRMRSLPRGRRAVVERALDELVEPVARALDAIGTAAGDHARIA